MRRLLALVSLDTRRVTTTIAAAAAHTLSFAVLVSYQNVRLLKAAYNVHLCPSIESERRSGCMLGLEPAAGPGRADGRTHQSRPPSALNPHDLHSVDGNQKDNFWSALTTSKLPVL